MVTETVIVGSGPVSVAVTPNGKYAYVANAGGNTVSVIHTASNTHGFLPEIVDSVPAAWQGLVSRGLDRRPARP